MKPRAPVMRTWRDIPQPSRARLAFRRWRKAQWRRLLVAIGWELPRGVYHAEARIWRNYKMQKGGE